MSIQNIPAGIFKCLMFYHYSHQSSSEASGEMGYLKVHQILDDGTKQEILNVNIQQAAWLPVKYNITDNSKPYSVRYLLDLYIIK